MTISELINKASAEIGTTEYPPNSNNVKYNTWYYGKEVNGDDYPWCAAFISWLFKDTNLVKKSASCMYMAQWFKDHKQWYTDPRPGDMVFFKFSGSSRWTNHVGLVTAVHGNTIETIEGNTSSDNKGSQSNGGMVAKRTRKKGTIIVGYGRPLYDDQITTIEYYPAYSGKSVMIDEVFRDIGVPDKYIGNPSNRKPLALANGVVGYSGTRNQNELLIGLARKGKLKKVLP